jgi:hypothetical protein
MRPSLLAELAELGSADSAASRLPNRAGQRVDRVTGALLPLAAALLDSQFSA